MESYYNRNSSHPAYSPVMDYVPVMQLRLLEVVNWSGNHRGDGRPTAISFISDLTH